MNYRGPGFLDVARFGSFLAFHLSQVIKLERRRTGRLRKRDNLLTRGGGEKLGGEVRASEEPNHIAARKPGPL
jgi:hypothetical protein